MLVNKNIIDTLKNQDRNPDFFQKELINKLCNLGFHKKKNFIINKTQKDNLGIYVWGDVGRGKTLIVKTFLKKLNSNEIIQFHYIDFMSHIHSEMNTVSGQKNPIRRIAKKLCKKYKIVFIDEFQVEDIADAMIVCNMLENILIHGSKLIMTSNVHPDDLYKNGLQREKFLNSLSIVKEKIDIYELGGDIDYRSKYIIEKDLVSINKIYSEHEIKDLIKSSFGINFSNNNKVDINKRIFKCVEVNNKFLWIKFLDFFNEPTASSDYKYLAKNFDWIFISDFIICDDESYDVIRRFISFIDIAYDKRIKIKFFFNKIHIDDIYKGTKLDILWRRCKSRLIEMQTYKHLNLE